MSCESCKMEPMTMSKSVHDSDMARMERANKRLWILVLVIFAFLCATNVFWVYEWTRYDYTGEETVVTQDGEGLNIYGDRNITDYGTDNPN